MNWGRLVNGKTRPTLRALASIALLGGLLAANGWSSPDGARTASSRSRASPAADRARRDCGNLGSMRVAGSRPQLIWDDCLYIVTSHGCCDTMTGHVMYSLETGQPVLYTTGWDAPGALAEAPVRTTDERRRWVGVYTSGATLDQKVFGPTPSRNVRALVTYASDTRALARVRVDFPQGSNDQRVDRLEIPANKDKDEATVTVQFLAYGDETAPVVKIPIRHDTLDVGGIVLPDGFSAHAEP
jgi:hypothetical protein